MFSQFKVFHAVNMYNQTLHPSEASILGSCLKLGSLGCEHNPTSICDGSQAMDAFLSYTEIYVFLLLCLCIFIVCLCIFIVPAGTPQIP